MRAKWCMCFLPLLGLLAACGGSQNKAVAQEDPQAAAQRAQRYEEMIARAEKKAADGRSEERLQEAIARFQQEIGRVPTNLTEIVSVGVLKELPKAPPGRQFYYAPEMGRVVLMAAPQQKPAAPAP